MVMLGLQGMSWSQDRGLTPGTLGDAQVHKGTPQDGHSQITQLVRGKACIWTHFCHFLRNNSGSKKNR